MGCLMGFAVSVKGLAHGNSALNARCYQSYLHHVLPRAFQTTKLIYLRPETHHSLSPESKPMHMACLWLDSGRIPLPSSSVAGPQPPSTSPTSARPPVILREVQVLLPSLHLECAE